MKKFLILCMAALLCLFAVDYLHFAQGIYIFPAKGVVTVNAKTDGKNIKVLRDGEFEDFEIKGVNLGAGKPGEFPTDLGITKAEYLRWFKQIKELGANTIRVYTILGRDFYDAVYEFNIDNPDPLYIIHGLWVNDYVHNSHYDAFADSFFKPLLEDSKAIVDIVHGKRKYNPEGGFGSTYYNKDISDWVIGYILGVEWEGYTVLYTNDLNEDKNIYQGNYLYTSEEATPFEAMLAQLGDEMIEYETDKYKNQRLVAFSNWPATAPDIISEDLQDVFDKYAVVDSENIKMTDSFKAGCFASYHIYPYYPDHLSYEKEMSEYIDESGKVNTYYAYLKKINEHHTIPVVISEFGVPASRGMASTPKYDYRNQGNMNETEQGEALVDTYNDIIDAGCAGSIAFIWQDEWFKRTWNTIYAVDLRYNAFWRDVQTNEQCFGLLSFEPGEGQCISYVDGDIAEWATDKPIASNTDMTMYAKYDESYVYLMVNKKGLTKDEKLYIPVDVTPKSGANTSNAHPVTFDRMADFVITLDGENNSRIMVQERYNTLRAMYGMLINGEDPYLDIPPVDTNVFGRVNLRLRTVYKQGEPVRSDIYETGLLREGNSNPNSSEFDSIADFCYGEDNVEIRIPWQLLNFSAPSEMKVHDDYYINHGVENINVKQIYFGIGTDKLSEISLLPLKLKGWHGDVKYHERLKQSYYILQKAWRKEIVE